MAEREWKDQKRQVLLEKASVGIGIGIAVAVEKSVFEKCCKINVENFDITLNK